MPKESREGQERLTNKNAAEIVVYDAEKILSDRHTKSILEHRTRRFIAEAGPIILEGTIVVGFAMGSMFFPLSYLYQSNDSRQTK